MSNARKASLQKCVYINDETPHRDPSTIFHSPFNQGSKNNTYNNPSYMSSEVFYPHQQTNLTNVNYSRTPKRSLVQDNNGDLFSSSKSPLRPQGVSGNKNQQKYSYMNDYQKFLEKQDQQSDTKSQISISNNNKIQNNPTSFQGNKTYHFGNKSISSTADIQAPQQSSSKTPKNAKNIQQQLNSIVAQDTTATSQKLRSHSQFDFGDVKKRIELESYQPQARQEYISNDSKSVNSQHSHNPSSLIKLEQVKNNQKRVSDSQKVVNQNQPVTQNGRTPSQVSQSNQSYTPKSHSRNGSQIFQFSNQKSYQDPSYQNNHQKQIQSNQQQQTSKNNTINPTQKLQSSPQTTHQHHYNQFTKSPTPKNFNKTENFGAQNGSEGFQPNQTVPRNASATQKRTVDLTSNQSTKGSNSNHVSQIQSNKNDRQPNYQDDAKSVTSTSSFVSQLVCNNCVNKDLIVDKQLRQQQEKERLAQLEKQAIENEQNQHFNSYVWQQEQIKNAKNQYNQEIKEHLLYKNNLKHQEQEREKQQRQQEQIQFQEEQDRVYRQKLEDLKNYREQYKKEIDMQIQQKHERKEREKQADKSYLEYFAAQREQDLHDYMNSVAQKQHQTNKIKEELNNQLEIKKRQQENQAIEEAKYKQQLEQQLAIDMKIREKQIQDRAEELRSFKEAWDIQQQHKQQQKVFAQKENEKIKQFQEAIMEQDKSLYEQNVQRNEYIKQKQAEQLQTQIEMKKQQLRKELEEKLQYGKMLKEQQERDLANARQNFHDCDRCHNSYPVSHLTKQKQLKSKPKFKF
ncbi:hypothetical protein TTHERM_00050530 (macronuclear) [Tetrahymena thermophila SB210]|uniref:Uncharacterized protein n=1 Tax=Tetrahymena thermophila (strain SB210) TaxID=312017 RepID=Q23D37_TETTS|nr:hypothetical protein TTHERM_00050530 [Tetrahymena thermophila SB210]EAR94328.1 hypothetical protein TTHERM_00050530 [Tetrahymena thermophila SB210]|eukprot:XP_001014849.1 hypothetical protein TTHERM_00050530 [Tetrahymena thermophila SB210]